jgi:anti-sigma factor RsiW
MTCQEFLARYSDYLDDLAEPAEAARLRAHLERCAACARYDRVLRRGLALVRELPPLEPSRDYYPRFQQRLALEEAFQTSRRERSGVGVAAAVVGVLALLAWTPVLMKREQPVAELAPMVARSPVMVEEGIGVEVAGAERGADVVGGVPVVRGRSPWWVQPASSMAFPPTGEFFSSSSYPPYMFEWSSFERVGPPVRGSGAWASYPVTAK